MAIHKSNLSKLGLSDIKAPSRMPKKFADGMNTEIERQKSLPRGWHAVKDVETIHQKTPGGTTSYKWVYYVMFFTSKGNGHEDSMLSASNQPLAETLADTLNSAKSRPIWVD